MDDDPKVIARRIVLSVLREAAVQTDDPAKAAAAQAELRRRWRVTMESWKRMTESVRQAFLFLKDAMQPAMASLSAMMAAYNIDEDDNV